MYFRLIIVRVVGILFILGGLVHWLIIFGFLKEVAPLPVTVYFHSLAVLSPMAGTGLIALREWGRIIGLGIAATQLPAHAYMLYLDNYAGWDSGLSAAERMLDMAFAVLFLVIFTRPAFSDLFSRRSA